MATLHENMQGHTEVPIASERSFGAVFTTVFIIIAVWPVFSSGPPRLWALGVAGVLLAVTVIAPRLFKPLNKIWFIFGNALSHVVNPLMMGLIFVITIIPTALIFKLLKKDPLRRQFDPEAPSYWIKREDHTAHRSSMKRQF